MGNNSVPKFIFSLSRFPVYKGSVLGRVYCNLDFASRRFMPGEWATATHWQGGWARFTATVDVTAPNISAPPATESRSHRVRNTDTVFPDLHKPRKQPNNFSKLVHSVRLCIKVNWSLDQLNAQS